MDKRFLVDQLIEIISANFDAAERERQAAAEVAMEGASESERRRDPRVALEFGGLARSHGHRAERARAELALLQSFNPRSLKPGDKIVVGAVIEMENDETGEGRTIFLAPVGAGIELAMPGGDGFVKVVTPSSPVGSALLGSKAGDDIEVVVRGEANYWAVTSAQ